MTRDEHLFHEERRTGLGGSDAAAAIGVSPWKTPLDLFLEKIGEAGPLPITEPMRWGTLLEGVILDEYGRRTGHLVHRNLPMQRHPDHDWLIGHIDGRVVSLTDRIVEAKTAGIGIGWGEPGTDEIPQPYLVQCHHYLLVTGAAVVDVAVLIGGQDWRLYEVHRDNAIAAELLDRERRFWQHVQDRVPPEPINTRDAVRRWGRLAAPGTVTASAAEQEVVERLREIRRRREELETEEDVGKRAIMAALAERGDTLVDLAGVPLATWKLDKGRAAYQVAAREPARRFLLKD